MRRQRNVKIVATVGPSSSSREVLRQLFQAGVDVFRLNMSHGTQADQSERVNLIREIEHEFERPIGILADLQGPKLRVGQFAKGPVTLEVGQPFRFDLDDAPGDGGRVQLPHPEIFAALEPGATLLVNDGKIRLKVRSCDASSADCEVVVGGEISNNKGVNVPDVVLPLAALTAKDRADLEFALSQGVDWLALSFVQRPEDVLEARELIGDRKVAVMVKVEKPAAVQRFAEILDVVDGIMVARGDLGVEMDIAELPPIQKRMIRQCRKAGKPVIVATQMLESMITSPMPTRAEVSDVATAIYEGADAVMLSAESAAGQFPVDAVSMMDRIAMRVEGEELHREIITAARRIDRTTVADAITAAAREVAEATHVKAICCFTHSGATAILAARERPSVPILAITPVRATARRLCLVWGLHCIVAEPVDRFKLAVISAVRAVRRDGFAGGDDRIVVTAGVPFNVPGSTNILRVAPCDEKQIYEGSIEY
ncbi:pyruvate kinase [Limibaculum sp. M0105]|uniref:Pyruvate kinase n=1 Tax=Thermohalobaculum xanthum TaxID=2753746 RepID=A0A8J7M807_9RHOB|nr:pyruvate kinase [Thermohalobaculum xanthum]MBK0399249.1 pyruvate kinase [Thermohalobaculum xanthum]